MNKSATVTKITLNIGGKIVELTPEQAKDLEKILHEMFGNTYATILPYPCYYVNWPYWAGTITYNNGTNADAGVSVYCSTNS